MPYSEEQVMNLDAILKLHEISAFEAQILISVYRITEHHIDLKTLHDRKIPKKFFEDQNNDLSKSVNKLIENELLENYIKKPVQCVRCAGLGALASKQIIDEGYYELLPDFDDERRKIDVRTRNLCVDVLGLTIGDKRQTNGPKGETTLEITGLFTSNTLWDNSNGELQYEREVKGKINCPQCSQQINFEFSYSPTSAYIDFSTINCENCSYTFYLAHYLYKYWE